MKKIVIILCLFCFPIQSVFAGMIVSRKISTGEFIEMQSHARQGTLIANAVNAGIPANDIEEVAMTDSEFKAYMESQKWNMSLVDAKIKKILIIREDAKLVLQSMTGYALGGSAQRATLQASLRQSYLDAKTTVNACSDIACVRAVKPVWPNDPGE